jgi:hypothetical protein
VDVLFSANTNPEFVYAKNSEKDNAINIIIEIVIFIT